MNKDFDRASDRVRPDADLLTAATQGDPRAFSILVRRHQPRAFAVAYGIVRSREDAQEVVQDAFLRVSRHLQDFAGQASFSTWLYRIVYNLSIDALRRRGVVAVHLPDEEDPRHLEMLPDLGPDADPLAHLERRRLAQEIASALDTLPPYHRTVFVLREVEGMSYAEIAHAERIPEGTVMSRLFHARRKMQLMLHPCQETSARRTDEVSGPHAVSWIPPRGEDL